jgi:light-regulated signal transduction histidine kinase (bacteriophytochrome)
MPQNILEKSVPHPTVNHERCAQEPVQLMDRIQSHGLLFALSEPDLKVRQVSANVSSLLGMSAQSILGRSFADALGAQQFVPFESQVLNNLPLTAMAVSLPPGNPRLETTLVAHRQDGSLIVELELCEGAHSLKPLDIDAHIRGPISRVESAASIEELSRLAAEEIRRIIGLIG